MRKFKFRLETLLTVRAAQEKQAEQAFAVAQGRLSLASRMLQESLAQFNTALAERAGTTAGERIDAASWLDRERYLGVLAATIEQQQRIVDTARMVAEEYRLELVKASQARESVSHLKKRDIQRYTTEFNRQEQVSLDELATQQAGRKRQEAAAALRDEEQTTC